MSTPVHTPSDEHACPYPIRQHRHRNGCEAACLLSTRALNAGLLCDAAHDCAATEPTQEASRARMQRGAPPATRTYLA
eukprot:354041-Chlamydomonas_euryale.AAC.8